MPAAVQEKIRVSKLLADRGICSRREADAFIEQGLVLLDGAVVQELGTRAYPISASNWQQKPRPSNNAELQSF